MKHRQLILSSVLLIVILIAINKFSPKKTADPGVLVPVELRCDGAVNPLCGSSAPILTWQLSSSVRGERPTAWQVRVATSEKILASDATDLWDSGKVGVGNEVMEETLVSRVDKIPGLRYEGQALKAGTRAHWQVRWWNAEDQVSPWSQIATWEVAPSSVADWQGARWMDDGKPVPTQDEDFYKPDPAPLMRHEFTVSKPIAKARLHFAGLGLGLANVNGSPVSDQVFDPAWTNFDKRILFRTHDVTDHLKEGENCLALMLGNGWYNPLPLKMWGNRNIRDSLPLGRPRAIALLVIDHPDGTTTTVKSGEGWKMAEGPTVRNSIYLGEERDARLDPV
ncbi:MAG: alpha-L-rhamnosidase N-terminal domain-containing protein, partial [Akkermansiaceae bacterium]